MNVCGEGERGGLGARSARAQGREGGRVKGTEGWVYGGESEWGGSGFSRGHLKLDNSLVIIVGL